MMISSKLTQRYYAGVHPHGVLAVQPRVHIPSA